MVETSQQPFVSVVIPIRNEEKYIDKCLNSVLEQDYPRECMELILVDGASEDKTVGMIKEYMERYPFIRLLDNPNKTVQYALNIGMKAARGLYIVRMDAHAEYAADFVSKSIAFLEKTDAVNVGGPMVARGKTTKQKVIAAAYHSPFALGGGKFHEEDYEGYADTVFLGAFRKSALEEVGYYDERLPRSEDDDLNFRFTERGDKIYITPQIRSVYYPRSDYVSLFRQYYEYGLWKVAVIKKHKKPARLSHLVPAAFVLFLAASIVLSLFFPLYRWFFGGVMLLYLLMDVWFSFKNPRLSRFSDKLRLMWVHFLLHVSYGLGFWQGIFRFLFYRF